MGNLVASIYLQLEGWEVGCALLLPNIRVCLTTQLHDLHRLIYKCNLARLGENPDVEWTLGLVTWCRHARET